MQTIGNKSTKRAQNGKRPHNGGNPRKAPVRGDREDERGGDSHRDLPFLLSGALVAVAASGAGLALAGATTPLRAPLTLFFLLCAPACALGGALRGLDPWGRIVAAAAGALALNLLVAQAMLALHLWSVRGGVLAIGGLSCAALLVQAVAARSGRHGAAGAPGDETAGDEAAGRSGTEHGAAGRRSS